jgi:hypothetical protein
MPQGEWESPDLRAYARVGVRASRYSTRPIGLLGRRTAANRGEPLRCNNWTSKAPCESLIGEVGYVFSSTLALRPTSRDEFRPLCFRSWIEAERRHTVDPMWDHSYTSSQVQAAAIEMLMARHPGLISRQELQRELGSRVGVDDALAYFTRLGIVHQVEGADGTDFFWATRTAMAAVEAATALTSGESGPHAG